jgi:hypothetical protein
MRNEMYSYDPHTTVRVPLTHREVAENSCETLFLITELSDAIRRGVSYYSMNGEPLPCINDVVQALIADGEVGFDDDYAEGPVPH